MREPSRTRLSSNKQAGTTLNLQNAMRAAMLLCSFGLSACAGPSGSIAFTESASGPQPFPTNYRTDLLAFMRTYLNDPVGVRGAAVAEPVQRTVGGNMRYVACVRYSAKDFNNRYTPYRNAASRSSTADSTVSSKTAPSFAPARITSLSPSWKR